MIDADPRLEVFGELFSDLPSQPVLACFGLQETPCQQQKQQNAEQYATCYFKEFPQDNLVFVKVTNRKVCTNG